MFSRFAMTKSRYLREYVPHPMTRLSTSLEFIQDIAVDAVLSFNESGQVESIVHGESCPACCYFELFAASRQFSSRLAAFGQKRPLKTVNASNLALAAAYRQVDSPEHCGMPSSAAIRLSSRRNSSSRLHGRPSAAARVIVLITWPRDEVFHTNSGR